MKLKDLTARIDRALHQSRKREDESMVLALVQSKSDKTLKHKIRLASDHTVYCTCDGWKWSKEKPKTCRHLERFKLKMKPQVL